MRRHYAAAEAEQHEVERTTMLRQLLSEALALLPREPEPGGNAGRRHPGGAGARSRRRDRLREEAMAKEEQEKEAQR